MTLRRLLTLPALVALLALPASAAPVAIDLDRAHSKVGFVAYTKIFDAVGKFSSFRASGTLDPDNLPASRIKITIDVATVDTDNGTRDDHLRTEDFFHVDKFPNATFESTGIKPTKKADIYNVTGPLTIHGVTKTVTVPVTITKVETKDGTVHTRAKGAFRVKRQAFGLKYESGLLMPTIKDDVDITFDLNFVPKK